jgi:hypothetical protein
VNVPGREPVRREWCNGVVRRGMVLVSSLAIALLLAAQAWAAAPNYILVSGAGLAHPVLLANWDQNLALLSALAASPRAIGATSRGLTRRPSLDLAEFWGWSGHPRPVRPGQANQHGRYYPAHGAQAAVIVVTVNGASHPRLVPASVLRIFATHHIPRRI